MRVHASRRVAAVVGITVALAFGPMPARAATSNRLPPIGHVFTIVLENEEFARTFGTGQVEAPYLARTLVSEGAFVPLYFGTGHSSLDNYIAMTSGQGPNPDTQDDCHDPSTLGDHGTLHFDGNGQAIGALGCTYPPAVGSIATQLAAAGRAWKGYMEDMDAEPGVHRTTCRGPFTDNVIESPVPTGHPKQFDDYAAKHDPFVYYHAVFDDLADCDAHVVPIDNLAADLQSTSTTPNYSFIVPDQCDDGHDMPKCSSGARGGPPRYDAYLRYLVPLIRHSPAYRADGLIVIVFDEGVSGIACCGEKTSPMVGSGTNSGFPFPGALGAGGGQTGAVLLSRFIRPGTVSTKAYNHYSYLRSIEDIFHLHHLGYAAAPDLHRFGSDIFTAP